MKKILSLSFLFLSLNLFAKDPFLSPELSKLIEQANRQDFKSQFELAKRYYTGDGVGTDKANAIKWLNRAAQSNYLPAQKALGTLLLDGDGNVSANAKLAIEWLTKAAENNDAESQGKLAKIYKEGNLTKKDYAKAALWGEKGADQGNADAQYYLGTLYHFGFGQKKDLTKALALYQQAANQGQVDAVANYGTMLVMGMGTAPDVSKGLAYLLLGRELGSKLAADNIAVMDSKKMFSEDNKNTAVASANAMFDKLSKTGSVK